MAAQVEKFRFNTRGGRVFDLVNLIVLSIIGLCALFPFYFVLVRSFAPEAELESS